MKKDINTLNRKGEFLITLISRLTKENPDPSTKMVNGVSGNALLTNSKALVLILDM